MGTKWKKYFDHLISQKKKNKNENARKVSGGDGGGGGGGKLEERKVLPV